MTTPQLQNIYHLRTVADASAKSCMVCFKPSTAVLITPDNKDFFYICRGHLKDRAFATAVVDEADVAAKKRQVELEREIELVKAEYAEKMKKVKAKDKGKGKGKKDGEDAETETEKEKEKLEKEKDEKIKAVGGASASASASASTTTTVTEGSSSGETTAVAAAGEDLPRIYALHRNFFQMRLDRIRNAELAKRNRERLGNPATFPSVPSGNP